MRIFFAWYDLWVGVYVDRKNRDIYFCPVPCVVLKFSYGSRPESEMVMDNDSVECEAIKADALDTETVVLLAKHSVQVGRDPDIPAAIQSLKVRKPYLFKPHSDRNELLKYLRGRRSK